MTKFTNQQLLTKGKFKLFLECPTQVYYYNNKKIYADASVEDDFLMSLAKGGHQVGALATAYYPEGHNIDTLNAYEAVEQTNKLLEQENVVIFEAALMFENKFCRVDILVKKGRSIKVIEVKSKSLKAKWFDDITDSAIFEDYLAAKDYEGVMNKMKAFASTTAGTLQLTSEWTPYCYDVAFQTWLASKLFVGYNIQSFLCCPDKELKSDCDDLNQKFMVYDNENGRSEVKTMGNVSPEALGVSILSTVDVTWLTTIILKGIENTYGNVPFEKLVNEASEICLTNVKPKSQISSICKSCAFNYKATLPEGKKNGFSQCASEYLKIPESELFSHPSVMEIWNFKPNAHLSKDEPVYFMKDLNNSDFNLDQKTEVPLNMHHRQLLQVRKVRKEDKTQFLAKGPLKEIMESFTYPLNFIDFETTMVALPFNRGERPYQMTAFQFSHHILNQDGKCDHATQWISLEKTNPNFAFVRALKQALTQNNGTIFRWSPHENTVLLAIREELDVIDEALCKDKKSLIDFINSITHDGVYRVGERDMVDMWVLYKQYHYMPETKGSNSIKAVLPATIGRFNSIHNVLGEEVYGKGLEFTSLNFESMAWMQKDETGKVKDPYKLLPKIFSVEEEEKIERLFYSDDIKNGGMAMMAYAVAQFKVMTVFEREKIKESLLRYCELDTFAMVLIYLYWYEECQLEYSHDVDYVVVEKEEKIAKIKVVKVKEEKTPKEPKAKKTKKVA